VFIINPGIQKSSKLDLPLTPELFKTECFKYADWSYVYPKLNKSIQSILDTCPLKNNKKYTLVDVKVHTLNKGQTPCIPGYHCDNTKLTFDNTDTDHYHLLVTGEPFTEFMLDSWVESNPPPQNKLLDSNKVYDFFKVEAMTWYSYGNFNYHRGTEAQDNTTRLLLRVCESDKIRPRNEHFKPSYY
jgi:hypothetical protein